MEMEDVKDETVLNDTNQDFVLNTRATCFLCLRGVSNPSPSHSVTDSDTKRENADKLAEVSLRSICHYLSLNLRDILTKPIINGPSFCNDTEQFNGQLSNFSVQVCGECSPVISSLSQMCAELELLEMKMAHSLKSFYATLENSEKELVRTEQFRASLNDPLDLIHGNALKGLRKVIKRKCSAKLKSVLPKVLISREEPQNIKLVTVNDETPIDSDLKLEPISEPRMSPATPLPNEQLNPDEIDAFDDIPTTPGQELFSETPLLTEPEPSPPPKTWKCNSCSHLFDERKHLLRHKKRMHPFIVKVEHICDHCNSKFESKTERDLHSKRCPQKRSISRRTSASKCGKRYTCAYCHPPLHLQTSQGARRHKMNHHADTLLISYKAAHVATMSDFKIYCEHVLKVEVLSCGNVQTAAGQPRLKCQHCTNSFYDAVNLRAHLIMKHQDVVAGKLVELQKSSSLQEILAIDLPAFSFPREQRLKCNECGVTFAHKRGLKQHLRLYCRKGPKTIKKVPTVDLQCGDCGKVFQHRPSLLRHRKQRHPRVEERLGIPSNKPEMELKEVGAVFKIESVEEYGATEGAGDNSDRSCAVHVFGNDDESPIDNSAHFMDYFDDGAEVKPAVIMSEDDPLNI